MARTPEPIRTIEEEMAKPSSPIRPAPAVLLRTSGARVLEWVKSHPAARGVQAQSLHLADGPAADATPAAASDFSTDAIVMGTRGLRPAEAIKVGSVAQDVCRTSNRTCIMVR